MSPKRTARKTKRITPDASDGEFELPPPPAKPLPVIKVVGISGSGKSTLVRALRAAGYDARPVSQEHSNVPTLWQQFDRPAYLIFLNASVDNQNTRRQDVTWSSDAHQEEARRLAHAREHADLRIDTGDLTPQGVYNVAKSFLTRKRVRHANAPLPPLPPTGSALRPSVAPRDT
jgi:RNase adaptor protein for sRNA GlmZ degradation